MTRQGFGLRLPWVWLAWLIVASRCDAGVWGMDPVVGVTADYATNPALVDAPDTHQANDALLLDLPTTYYADALKFSLLPSFRLSDTHGYSSVTSDYEHLNARGEYDTERSTLTATAGVARDSSLYFDYLSDGTAGVRRDTALADLDYDRFLTEKLELNADANTTRVRYGDTTGVGTLVDYRYLSLAPTLSWYTVERNKYTLLASVGRYNSLDGTTESRSANLQIGLQRQLTEQWSLNASGGYSRALNRIDALEYFRIGPYIEEIPEHAESAQNGSVYSVSLSRQGALLLLTATASQQIQPTGFAFLSRQQSYELKATYTFSPRWNATADLRQVNYNNPEPSGVFYNVKVPYASVAANWQWTEHWTLSINATNVRETVHSFMFQEASSELSLTLSRSFNHIDFH
jgi:hypothetical protein